MSSSCRSEAGDTSECSSNSCEKKGYHFGLYRSVDNKTEEFLRMSKAKQIRRLCACSVATTAITVALVVAILMIYDYSVAVESSLLQINSDNYNETDIQWFEYNDNDTVNIDEIKPIADKLDRGNIYFDQETFEKIPFLINDLKDTDLVDSAPDVVNSKEDTFDTTPGILNTIRQSKAGKNRKYGLYWSSIRRTSPRPFIYEYKEPSPAPFKKAKRLAYRSWVDQYRNNQRLRNIEHIINYLKNTVKVQVGDLVPSSNNIALSGVYVESKSNEDFEEEQELEKDGSATILTEKLAEAVAKQTNNSAIMNANNFNSDPLYNYKPEHPSDVNTLVDPTLRSSTILKTNTNIETKVTIPMFRPIKLSNKNRIPTTSIEQTDESTVKHTTRLTPGREKSKLLSVMLDIYPMDEKDDHSLPISDHSKEEIITTKYPKFRPRPTVPGNYALSPKPLPTQLYRPQMVRPMFYQPIRPTVPFVPSRKRMFQGRSMNRTIEPAKMLLHLNLFPKKRVKNSEHQFSSRYVSKKFPTTQIPSITSAAPTPVPVLFSTTVLQPMTTPSYSLTTMDQFFAKERIKSEIEAWTKPPEIIKFSREDAKIPDDFPILRRNTPDSTAIEQRSLPATRTIESSVSNSSTIEANVFHSSEVPISFDATTTATTEEPIVHITPQINGHYRSLNRNSQQVNEWISKDVDRELIEDFTFEPKHKQYKVIQRSDRLSNIEV